MDQASCNILRNIYEISTVECLFNDEPMDGHVSKKFVGHPIRTH